jgi:hypothetical protein
MPNHQHCCFLDCPAAATWHIADGAGPDDYTHACDAHRDGMSTQTSTVTPLEEVTNG